MVLSIIASALHKLLPTLSKQELRLGYSRKSGPRTHHSIFLSYSPTLSSFLQSYVFSEVQWMRLQAHRAAVERPSVVAPELDEAAAVGLTRDLAAAVLEARIHSRSVGTEGETSRLVAVIHRTVGLEYGVAIAGLVDCVNARRLSYETKKAVEVSK